MQYSKHLLIGESVTQTQLQNTGTGYLMFEDYSPLFYFLSDITKHKLIRFIFSAFWR